MECTNEWLINETIKKDKQMTNIRDLEPKCILDSQSLKKYMTLQITTWKKIGTHCVRVVVQQHSAL